MGEQPQNADLEQRFCRTCKLLTTHDAQVLSVFSKVADDSDAPIDAMLLACTSIRIEAGDDFPKIICVRCVDQLQAAYRFRVQCQQTDKQWRQLLAVVSGAPPAQDDDNAVVEAKYKGQSSPPSADGLVQSGEGGGSSVATVPDSIEFNASNQMILTCGECSKAFSTVEGLRSHKRLHSGALFKCRYCEKRYTRSTHVRRHESAAHGKDRKMYICRVCGKTLTRSDHLRRHLVTHLVVKPFQCERCQRGFGRSEHLAAHEPRCNGELGLVCEVCNRTFGRQDSLDEHRRRHNTELQQCKVPAGPLPTLSNIDNVDLHFVKIDLDADANAENKSVALAVEQPEARSASASPVSFTSSSVDEENAVDDDDDDDVERGEPVDPDEQNNIFEPEVQVKVNNNGDSSMTLEAEDEEEQETKLMIARPTERRLLRQKLSKAKSPVSERMAKKRRGRGRPPTKHKTLASSAKTKSGINGSTSKTKAAADDGNGDGGHINGKYPCVNCDEHFETMHQLEVHVRHQHATLKMNCCKLCNKEFTRYCHLKRHMWTHTGQKPFECDVCTKRFTRKDHLKKHRKMHDSKVKAEPMDDDTDDLMMTATDNASMQQQQREFRCDLCDLVLSRSDHLRRHKTTKHGVTFEKRFKCDACPKSFTTDKYRSIHIKTYHSASASNKLFQCDFCEKCFLHKHLLNEHKKFHNESSKKFLCSECGQGFIRRDYLIIHMRRHSGEKPFKCRYCGKGFPRTTDLTVHERYHTGEKTHLCTVCGRGFGRAYNLTVHMRTHTGEKPYKCTYCDAAFAQGNDLKAHVRRHTGERYQCEICSQSFIMGYHLTKHKRTVHGLNIVGTTRRLNRVPKPPKGDGFSVMDDSSIGIASGDQQEQLDENEPNITVPEIRMPDMEAQQHAVAFHHLAQL